MNKNFSKSLPEELQKLSNQFPTQPRPEFLKSVLEYLLKKYDGETIRLIFYAAIEQCERFPNLKQFDDLALSLNRNTLNKANVPKNFIPCLVCNDNGFLFAIHEKHKSQAIYGCTECSVGRWVLKIKKTPSLQTVTSLGYLPENKIAPVFIV